MKFLQKKNESGFTIIEVMIVLAIAGVMIAAVLVAVPQLQRNQRNSARKAILGRIKTEIDSYAGNNNGTIPAATTASGATNLGAPNSALGFFTRYIGCTGAANPTCTIDVRDPRSGFVVGMGANGNTQTIAVANNAVATPSAAVVGSLAYATQAQCNGENIQANGNSRSYAFAISLEGGASYCLDNR